MSRDDIVFHLALWVRELIVVEVRVVWMFRVVELDECLGREQGVVGVHREGGGLLV